MNLTVNAVVNRAKREVINQFAPATRLTRRRHSARIERHRRQLPPLSAGDAHLVSELVNRGIAITTLEDLALPGTAQMQRLFAADAATLAARSPGERSAVWLSHAELTSNPVVWRWGLTPRILDIAENYIGLPLTYYGSFVARQVADGRTVGTRHWHRDIEDHRVLKALIWLNDVDAGGGPFEYLPLSQSQAATRQLKYVAGYLDDETMRRAAPVTARLRATGPTWTVVLADTARLFHRGAPPTETDRFSVTYTWTSRTPIKTMPAVPYTSDQISRIRDGLTDRQSACLPAALRADWTSGLGAEAVNSAGPAGTR